MRKVAKDEGSKDMKKVKRSLHHISVQNSVLHHEITGLKEVLKTQKKHKKKSKTLELQHHKDYHGGAEFYSPSRVEEARARERTKQQEQKAEELKKAEMAELRHANKLYKEKIAQERREQKLREKEEREQRKAEKAQEVAKRKAQRERDKQAHNAQKAIQLPKIGKRKASQEAAPRKKQNRGSAAARSRAAAVPRSPSPPATYNSRGRPIRAPRKFE